MLIPYIIVIVLGSFWHIATGKELVIPYYWYLDFVLFWYLVFYAVLKIPGAYEKRYWILGIASGAVFLCGNGLRAEQAISFLLGIWISDHYEIAVKKMTSNKILFLCGMMGIFILASKQVPMVRDLEDSLVWYALQLIMKVFFAIVILGMSQKLQWMMKSKLITMLGIISYEFYLIHMRLLKLPQRGILGMIAFIGLSLLLSGTINLLIRKLKRR